MKKQTQANTCNVGIYCRLSREDGGGESASIGSQKLILFCSLEEVAGAGRVAPAKPTTTVQ